MKPDDSALSLSENTTLMFPSSPAIPLLSLRPGERAVLHHVSAVAPGLRQRLLELGLIADTPVELVRFAPMGGPIQLNVDGTHISLRRHDAGFIRVRRIP